jgi:phosphatidylinositol-bisphosphatase
MWRAAQGNKGGVALRLAFTPPEPEQAKVKTLAADAAEDKEDAATITVGVDPADVPLPASASASTFASSGSGSASELTLAPHLLARSVRPAVLTFVCSHLAAFDEQAERRHADFHDLSRRLSFPVSVPVLTTVNGAGDSETAWPPRDAAAQVTTGVFDSDVLVWMGDLNYRVDLPDGQVRALLSTIHTNSVESSLGRESMALLLRHDQLKKAMRGGRAFVGFEEHEIQHLPSYRFSPGVAADALGYDLK